MTRSSNSGKRLGFKEFLLTLFLMILVYLASDVLGLDLTGLDPVIDSDPTGEVRVLFTAPQSEDDPIGPDGPDRPRGLHRSGGSDSSSPEPASPSGDRSVGRMDARAFSS